MQIRLTSSGSTTTSSPKCHGKQRTSRWTNQNRQINTAEDCSSRIGRTRAWKGGGACETVQLSTIGRVTVRTLKPTTGILRLVRFQLTEKTTVGGCADAKIRTLTPKLHVDNKWLKRKKRGSRQDGIGTTQRRLSTSGQSILTKTASIGNSSAAIPPSAL